VKLCECGCGEPTVIAKRTVKRNGIRKGESRRFIWGHNPVKHGKTKKDVDQHEYFAEWARKKRAKLRDMMTPEELAAKEERIRLSRFGGKPSWNKGKKTEKPAWNTGKTKEMDERIRRYAEKLSASIKELWKKPDYEGGNKKGVKFNLTDEQRKKYSERLRRENNPSWRGGVSFFPYPEVFIRQLRIETKKRDDFTCQICGLRKVGSVHSHHINYDKNDIDEFNLITLCVPCHGKTRKNRSYWQEQLKNIMEERRKVI